MTEKRKNGTDADAVACANVRAVIRADCCAEKNGTDADTFADVSAETVQKMAEMQVRLLLIRQDAEPRAVHRAVSCAEFHAETGADARAVVRAEPDAEKFAPIQILWQMQNRLQMSVQCFVQKADSRVSF